MRFLRATAFPLWLARVRLAKRLERVALVGLGIAAGSAMLAAVLGGSLLAQDQSVQRAASHLRPADRAVRAFWLGIPAQGAPWRTLDRQTRSALGEISGRRAVGAMLYRETSIERRLVDLGAVDGLARFVHLRSGRLPRRCRPERCEVLQLGGSGRIPSVPGLRLVLVGRASLASAVPFGDLITRETYRSVLSTSLLYHTPATPPFLLADDVEGLARAPALVDLYRSYVWALPVAPEDVHTWSIGSFSADVVHARSALEADSDLYDVTAPTDRLQAANEQSKVGGRRLLLIGGEAAALLLAFTILAARPRAATLPRRRADRGARRRQRRPRLRGDRRPRARERVHERDRQPRPGVRGDRRPRRADPRRPCERGVDARERGRGLDRRRPGRLAPAAGGLSAPGRDPDARDGAARRRRDRGPLGRIRHRGRRGGGRRRAGGRRAPARRRRRGARADAHVRQRGGGYRRASRS